MSKIVCTMIIDIDEDGIPHRRDTGSISHLPEHVQQTFAEIRQRYKFVQARTQHWKNTNSNPWMKSVYARDRAAREIGPFYAAKEEAPSERISH